MLNHLLPKTLKNTGTTLRRLVRRLAPWAMTALAIWLVWKGMEIAENRLGRSDFASGYTLAAACTLLFLLSARKKLLVLPLGRVSFWLQAHQYFGVFALAIFFLHVGWPIRGWMESVLASVFLFISGSGLLGWYLNRTTPKKLSVIGHEFILEDIPGIRQQLAERAYAIAIAAAGRLESTALAEHYGKYLVPFFQGKRSLSYALIPTGRLRRQHLENLERLDRYLNSEGRASRNQMSALVQAKDDLDFQLALQRRLRTWVIFHVMFVWFFVFLSIVHGVLAHRFHGN